MPDRRAREPVHLRDAEPRGRAGRVLHSLCRALSHAVLRAVAPDVRREDRLVARIDAIAYGLADEVCAERPAAEPVLFEERPMLSAVRVVGEGSIDLEVISPARQFETVEPPAAARRGEFGDGQIRPLTGEQRYRAGHRVPSFMCVETTRRAVSRCADPLLSSSSRGTRRTSRRPWRDRPVPRAPPRRPRRAVRSACAGAARAHRTPPCPR